MRCDESCVFARLRHSVRAAAKLRAVKLSRDVVTPVLGLLSFPDRLPATGLAVFLPLVPRGSTQNHT